MIFLKNLFKGVGLATLFLNIYNMTQDFFLFDDIFLKKTPIPYLTIGKVW